MQAFYAKPNILFPKPAASKNEESPSEKMFRN
jgi:hypothetical protein